MGQKLSSWKISKDKTSSNGLFLAATLSQHAAKYFLEEFSPENFSGRAEIEAPVEASEVYYCSTA